MADVIRRVLRKRVVGVLTVACFVGAGWLASGYFNPAPAPATSQVDQGAVWKDLEQRRAEIQKDITPAPTPSPSPTRRDSTERSA